MLVAASRCGRFALRPEVGSGFDLRRLASSRPLVDVQYLGSQLADSLQSDPEGTASAVAGSLDPQGRRALLSGLFPAGEATVRNLEDTYVDKIFEQADFKDGNGLLDRCSTIKWCTATTRSISFFKRLKVA